MSHASDIVRITVLALSLVSTGCLGGYFHDMVVTLRGRKSATN